MIYDNLHHFRPGKPYFKSINFACVVFDGLMFAYKTRSKGFKLIKLDYIKYKHEFNISTWMHTAEIRNLPLMKLARAYQKAVNNVYIVEIINKNYLSQYVDKLNQSISEFEKAPISFWGEINQEKI